MGKSKPKEPSSSIAQAEISKQLFRQSDPLRRAMIGLNMGFLGIPGQEQTMPGSQTGLKGKLGQKFPGGGGGLVDQSPKKDWLGRPIPGTEPLVDPSPIQPMSFGNIDASVLPQFGAAKMMAENQYKRARENALTNVPRGGPMAEALTNIDIGRAQHLTGISSDLADRQLQQAFSLATGMPQQAMQGLGSSAAAQAQAQQAAASQNASKGQALGTVAAATIMKNPAAGAAAGASRGASK